MAESKLKLSLVMDMVDKITAPIQKVTTQTTKAGEKIKATQDSLKQLGQQSSDIEHFRKLKTATAQTSKELDEAQAKANRLGQQMQNTAKPTRKMTAEFNKAQAAVSKLKAQQQSETDQLQKLRGKLAEAGVSTNKLNEATRKIKKETQAYNEQLKKEQSQLDKIAKQQERIGQIKDRNSNIKAKAATDAVGVGAAVFGVKQLVDAQGEISSAQGEIGSLGLNDAEVAAITQKAKEFSNQWAGTTQAEFIKASYDIKSGISTLSAEAVGEFTKIAALTATATKSTVGEMTGLFATGYGIYNKQFQAFGAKTIDGWEKMSQAEKDAAFGTYFSDGIAASVQQFKTDGSQMQGAISALGAAATSSNVPFAEQLSILGQLQATMSGSEAATKYKSFLNAAAGAGEKLGLSFLDANDQLLSMPEILQELRDKYGETLTDMDKMELKKAFGSDEAMALITQLYPEIDTLKGNINSMNGALLDGGKNVNKMATSIATGPSESMQLLTQRVGNMTAAIGLLFAPAVMFVSDVIGQGAIAISSFTENFPILSQVLAFVVVGMIAFKTASIASRLAYVAFSDSLLFGQKVLGMLNIAQMKNTAVMAVSRVKTLASAAATAVMSGAQKALALATAFTTSATVRANAVMVLTHTRTLAAAGALLMLSGVQKALAAGTAVMTGAQWALNAAMMANPIGLVIAGVMALIAVVALVVKYWEPISGFFANLWGGVKSVFSGAWEGIKNTLAMGWEFIKTLFSWSPLGLIIQAWEPITGFFGSMWEGIKGMFSGAMEWLKSMVLAPIETLKNTLGAAWNALFGSDGEEVTHTVKKVAEDVPALSNPAAAQVTAEGEPIPKPRSTETLSAGNQTTQSVSYQFGDIIVQAAPGMNAQEVAQEVARQLAAEKRKAERKSRTLAVD
ncbi:phage tail tape measure protein [Vibrio parahaemolyticus]|nr:phage tail tape measure protein [Vibrio parahaemolyticus]